MICENCQKLGEKSKEAFAQAERIFLLTSTATMMKHIMANPNAPEEDKIVANSVTTKLLLSFPKELRQVLLMQLRRSAGVAITMDNCPHGTLVIS